MADQIPAVVVSRLPLYLRALLQLLQDGVAVVSSQELAAQLQVTPAQIRKDLSYFGKFGKQGKGYNVSRLVKELRSILGLEREWSMAVVGMGRLGRAIVHYGGFAPQGFKVVAVFDNDPKQIGKKVRNLVIQHIARLEEAIRERPVDIGIVAVPSAEAQKVIDILVRSGIKAILNYAPAPARVPPTVQLRKIDPVLSLQSMTFYLKDEAGQK